jgi:ATP-dependent DNA ligase
LPFDDHRILTVSILRPRQHGTFALFILAPVHLPHFQPLPLSRARAPFSHPDWIFEVKWDGFRALLHSDEDGVRLVSRNRNTFQSFSALCEGLAGDLNGRRCVLDGEIVCLDSEGKPQFRDLLFRRNEPHFMAFDLLWDEHAKSDDEVEQRRFRNGEDTRYLPLSDRKLRLRTVVPTRGKRLLYCDHIDADGEALFRLACENDLEGIVAKRKSDPYLSAHTVGLRFGTRGIRNGSGEQNCSNASAGAIRIFRCGMDALWRATQSSKTSTHRVSSFFKTPNSSERGTLEPPA